jgi:hypothetical protein
MLAPRWHRCFSIHASLLTIALNEAWTLKQVQGGDYKKGTNA